MVDNNTMSILAALMQQGHQPQPSPFYSQSRPYGEINDAAVASSRDGGVLALLRLMGGEMTPNQRVQAGWADAAPPISFGSPARK
jgi:hypothetical protein